MRKPNIIFLSVIALAALLPQTSRWFGSQQPVPVTMPETAPETSSAIAQPSPILQPLAVETTPPQQVIATKPETAAAADAEDARNPWHVLPIEEPIAMEDPLAGLEEAYMVEAFDPAWAQPLEAGFHSVFDSVRLQDSVVEQAECRTTLCRFAITHKDSLAQDAFVQAFLQSRLLPLNQVSIAQHSQRAEDGSIAAVYFLSRNELAQVQN